MDLQILHTLMLMRIRQREMLEDARKARRYDIVSENNEAPRRSFWRSLFS